MMTSNPTAYRAPISDIAFTLFHSSGFGRALADGLYGDLTEAAAAKALSAIAQPSDTILLKGSRAIHLEEIAAALESPAQASASPRRRTAS